MRRNLVAFLRWLAAVLGMRLVEEETADWAPDSDVWAAIDDDVDEEGSARQVAVHRLGGRISDDAVAWESEQRESFANGVLSVVEERSIRLCDCGTAIGYDVSIWGRCSVEGCGQALCKECVRRCERCGVVVCGRHSVRLGEHVFCWRHRWLVPWLAFWR